MIYRMVLATDMAVHFNHVADFRTKLKAESHSGDGETFIPHDMASDWHALVDCYGRRRRPVGTL